jgi:DNA-binding XRE family transcriptional regulator
MQTKDRPISDVEGLSLDFAMSVISARLNQIPVADRQDFHELWEFLLSTADPEEIVATRRAMIEILTRQRSGIRKLSLEDAGRDKLSGYREYVGERIRAARKAAGLTQEELAAKAGILQGYISRLESNEHSPSHKTLKRIADALGIPVTEFDPSCDPE